MAAPVDLQADTEPGHAWFCSACPFTTTSLAYAKQHCEEESGDYPSFEHGLEEMPARDTPRNRARRVISCRLHDRVVEPRVTRCNWRYIDGRWEIKGVTVSG